MESNSACTIHKNTENEIRTNVIITLFIQSTEKQGIWIMAFPKQSQVFSNFPAYDISGITSVSDLWTKQCFHSSLKQCILLLKGKLLMTTSLILTFSDSAKTFICWLNFEVYSSKIIFHWEKFHFNFNTHQHVWVLPTYYSLSVYVQIFSGWRGRGENISCVCSSENGGMLPFHSNLSFRQRLP